jgi:hypothetical protein
MKYCLGLLLCVSCTCSSPTERDGEPLLFPANFATTFQAVRDCRLSNAHDMHFISVAANAKAADLYREGRYPLPVGSILVKTLHDDPTCTTPVGYVAMRKDGDWVWQKTAANFEVRNTGALQSCIACHSACGDRDLTCTDP